MKLSDETAAPVGHAEMTGGANAARRKAFLESGEAYAGLTSRGYLVTGNKPCAGWLPRHRYALWRHFPVFMGVSPVLRKFLLPGEQRASPQSPPLHHLTPDRRLSRAKWRPWNEGQTQVDGRRVQRIGGVLQPHAQAVTDIELSGLHDQVFGKFSMDAPVKLIGAGDRFHISVAVVPIDNALDVRLSDGNSFEVLAAIRAGNYGTQVIMMSENPFEQYRTEASRLGAAHFFHKSQEFEKIVPTLMLMKERLK